MYNLSGPQKSFVSAVFMSHSDRDQFQLSTLSHLINARASGYQDLPEFPDEAPDPSVRCVEVPVSFTPEPHHRVSHQKKTKPPKAKSFYSDESSPEDDSDEEDETESESESDSDSSDSDSSDSSSEEDEESESEEEPKQRKKPNVAMKNKSERHQGSQSSGTEDSDSSTSSSSSGSSSSSEEESDDSDVGDQDEKNKKTKSQQQQHQGQEKKKESVPGNRSNLDLLLDLDDAPPSMDTPVLTPSLGGLLTPSPSTQPAQPLPPGASIQPATAKFVPTATQEVLNRISGSGLSVACRFTRSPHLYSPRMTSVELSFTNSGTEEIRDISVGNKKLAPGMSLHEFAGMTVLKPDTTLYGTLGVDFNDTTQPAVFDLVTAGRTFSISITAPVGELLMPLAMSEADFNLHQVCPFAECSQIFVHSL